MSIYNLTQEQILELIAQGENELVELKEGNINPEEIGKYISALANSAVLLDAEVAYYILGVKDDKTIVGTNYNLYNEKKGNENLENWLNNCLKPNVQFKYETVMIKDKAIGVFVIHKATSIPIAFNGVRYIRTGSSCRDLLTMSDKERLIWSKLKNESWEEMPIGAILNPEEISRLIDIDAYFRLCGTVRPESIAAQMDSLIQDKLVVRKGDAIQITNLGAILLARSLNNFDSLQGKTLRIIRYKNDNKAHTLSEKEFEKGYALIMNECVETIMSWLPQKEKIQGAKRISYTFPEIVIREILANALIHQDFTIQGTHPMVEIFSNRIEITNNGIPIIDPKRFIDNPPRSRNERVASLMRRFGFCEERGSGYDKVILALEAKQMPSPNVRLVNHQHTIIKLDFIYNGIYMDTNQRIEACYTHACIEYLSGRNMTNGSLTHRLGMKDANKSIISDIIKRTKSAGLICDYSENQARKSASYVPFWAKE
jgi:predicted HTH transcriptional regulator